MKLSYRRHIAGLTTIVAIALCAISCNPYTPSRRQTFPQAYTLAYEEIYGHCYDSIPYAVVALDLYSDGITLNKDHRIQGTGFNLYLSDVIVPDSLLVEGEYTSATTARPFTCLPGRDYEGTPHGMYILTIEEDKVLGIQVLDSGSFVFRNDSLLFTLYYRNAYGQTVKYQPQFAGTLLPWRKK